MKIVRRVMSRHAARRGLGRGSAIVVGRWIADGKHFLVGSVVSKLIHKAVNLTVCVVQ
jgi:hypothetical protein